MARFAHPRAGLSGFSITRFVTATLSVLVALAVIGMPGPAAAQGFGWLGNLFGGGLRPFVQPRSTDGYRQQPDNSYQPRTRVPRRRVSEPVRPPREDDNAARAAIQKAPAKTASAFVYVFGDSFGQSLASGLDDALVDRPDVAVMHKAKGSSGLVASDFYDWPKVIDDLLAESAKASAKADQAKTTVVAGPGQDGAGKDGAGKDGPGKDGPGKSEQGKVGPRGEVANSSKIDVAVMMIGSNDRQPLREGGKMLAVGTPEWTAAYKKRVISIDEAFRRRNIPLVWVGVPIARDDDFADDMAAFNDIYREAAAKTGAVYVDTWEAFSDDDGDFSPVGPDINGQIVRLRTADGVYFTRAGGRKLAHFVEAHVRRALDGKVRSAPEAAVPAVEQVARKPDVGPVSSLTEPPSAQGGRLAASVQPERVRDAQGEERSRPPTGRADDLRWAGTPTNP